MRGAEKMRVLCQCGRVDVSTSDHAAFDGLMVYVHALLIACYSFAILASTTAPDAMERNG